MKSVLIFEWFSGGGLWIDNQPPSFELVDEGRVMLETFTNSLTESRSLSVFTLQDERVQLKTKSSAISIQTELLESQLQQAGEKVDYIFLIAPETNRRGEWCWQAMDAYTEKIVSPPLDFIQLASDKLTLSTYLQEHNIPIAASTSCTGSESRFVRKPRSGAGGLDASLVDSIFELENQQWVREPYVQGSPVSVSVIRGPLQTTFLPPTAQRFKENTFEYLTSTFPISDELAKRATHLAKETIAVLPEFRGYIGIDMVLGDFDVVIEINPRLTRSYEILEHRCENNLAEAIIKIATGETVDLKF